MSKVKRLVVRQALGLEEYAINFGNVNIISGGNERGKTSILEIIEKALYNTDRRDKFVRTGADKAFIELETDDGMKVERIVNAEDGKSTVKVTREGIPVRAPQTFLDQLLGVSKERKDVFAFNPVDFMSKDPKEQCKIILSMMPIIVTQADMLQWFERIPPVNPNMHGLLVLKELEKYWYDARREANGAVRATAAEVEALQKQLPDNYQVEEWENLSTMALSDEIREGEKVNNYRKQGQEIIDGLEASKQAINNKYDLEIKNLSTKYDGLIEDAKNKVSKEKDDLELKIEGLKTRTANAIQEINKQIETLKTDTTERRVQINKEIAELEQRIALLRQELGQLDGNLETAIKAKQAEITSANESLRLSIENVQKEIKGIDGKVQTEIEGLNKQREIEIKNKEDTKKVEIDAADERVAKAEKYLAENPEVDIKPLEEKYAEAEKMKGFVEMAHNLQNVIERLEKETALAEKYDGFVELCRKKPAELLKTINLPVKGLAIKTIVNGDKEENIVVFDDLTLKNHNTAKQVKICIDIAKAYAKDNPMKLICVDKIEHLDATARAEFFRQIEADNEYQYFVTWVTDGAMVIDTKGQV